MTQVGVLTLFRCCCCTTYWMRRVFQDSDIVCVRCGRRGSWEVRHQVAPQPVRFQEVSEWDPWETPEDYFNARSERLFPPGGEGGCRE